jgi:serine/threonine protein kinase
MTAAGRGLVSGARHELLVKIAIGGTSTVFVGRRRGSAGAQELVAVKRMHPYLADDADARKQMLREANVARQVRHPNLVPIREVEQVGDELLLIMDYIEGGSLAELTAGSRLDPAVALRILLDVCAGLTALHGLSGFVHRDVSPQNILVGLDGVSRVGDFGLVKRTDVSTTHTTVVRGKAAYMAPEQIEGAPATQRSDIFALGVVAWELLSGQRLFRGENDADTLRRVLVAKVPPLSGHVPELPASLDGVVANALRRDVAKRIASVATLQQDFEACPIHAASHERVAAIVQEVLGSALAKRQATVVAMASPEQTATGNVDIDEMLERAREQLSTQPPVVPGSDTQSMDDLPTVLAGPLSNDTAELHELGLSLPDDLLTEPPSSSAGSSSAPHRSTKRLWSTRAIVGVAVVAATGGALGSWLLGRPVVAPVEHVAPAVTTTPSLNSEQAPAPPPAPSPTQSHAPSLETQVPGTVASPTAKVDNTTARKSKPKGNSKTLVVPDNPYR